MAIRPELVGLVVGFALRQLNGLGNSGVGAKSPGGAPNCADNDAKWAKGGGKGPKAGGSWQSERHPAGNFVFTSTLSALITRHSGATGGPTAAANLCRLPS